MTRKLMALAFPFLDEGMNAASLGRAGARETALQMDEETFRAFYNRTATGLWAYLARATGDPNAADDLLQDAYFRFLRATVTFESEAHQRHYLFRIASNLVCDRYRRPRLDASPLPDESRLQAAGNLAMETERRSDLRRAMAKLRPLDRDLLWLAYGQGSSHQEIAGSLGLAAGSIKPLLFRAKKKLATLLTAQGTRFRGRG